MDDAPAATRRAGHAEPPAGPRRALEWVDEEAVATTRVPVDEPGSLDGRIPAAADLLAQRPRRPVLRSGTLVPFGVAAALAGVYAATTLLWPLYAVEPTVTAVPIAEVVAPASAVAFPADGSAAVSVRGMGSVAASSGEAAPMASITKLVTVLMVLEQMPLQPGEQGPTFAFTYRDQQTYWEFLGRDESALDVPVDGVLTQYQMLQGILLGSAGNYVERLASTLWPTDRVFARAASDWLARHGLTGITVVEPTGIDETDAATPAALMALAEVALADPVLAEIVRTRSVDLPGAGLVENTNDLLADPEVVGLKTGSLWNGYNLLAARETPVGDQIVRVDAAVLGQPTDALRDGETLRLLTEVGAELSQPYVVPAGTIAGVASTLWGASVPLVTDADAAAVLWNGASAKASADLALGDAREAAEEAGTLTLTGPLGAQTVPVRLTATIAEPDAWWRLTHPLELFGLAG